MSKGYNHVWRNYWERYQRKKLLGIISSFKKVTGYKTKTQKLILFLRTINEHPEMVIKNIINNSIHKHKMLKNKFNKICARFIY